MASLTKTNRVWGNVRVSKPRKASVTGTETKVHRVTGGGSRVTYKQDGKTIEVTAEGTKVTAPVVKKETPVTPKPQQQTTTKGILTAWKERGLPGAYRATQDIRSKVTQKLKGTGVIISPKSQIQKPRGVVSEAQIPRGRRLDYSFEKLTTNKSGSIKGQLVATGVGITQIGLTAGKTIFVDPLIFGYQAVRYPKQTAKSTYSFFADPEVRGRALEQARYTAVTQPGKAVGVVLGTALAPRTYTATTSKIKGAYIKTGSKFVDPSELFSPQVLEKGKTLPTAKSFKESVSLFKKGKTERGYVVGHASPQKISSNIVTIPEEAKAFKGVEDPGLYVAPKGEGSPYFTRMSEVGGYDPSPKLSLNPFKDIRKVPTFTEFENIQEIAIYPKEVLESPGFSGVAEYQKTQVGKGKVFITKRSMIGQGVVRGKGFKGTSEIEGVLPIGTQFQEKPSSFLGKLKGFDYYTEFKGQPVAVRRAEVLTDLTPTPIRTTSKTLTLKEVSRIRKGASYVTSTRTRISPISYFGLGSSILTSPSKSYGLSSTSISRGLSSRSYGFSSTRSRTSRTGRGSSILRGLGGSSRLGGGSSISRITSRSSTTSRTSRTGRGSSILRGFSDIFTPTKPTSKKKKKPKPRVKYKKKETFTFNLPKYLYRGSVQAETLGIFGKASKREQQTGIGLRGL